MALYTKQFTKPYPNGYVDKPQKTTPVTADILNMQDDTLSAVEDFLTSEDVGFKDKLTVGTRNIYASQQGPRSLSVGENNSAQGKNTIAIGTGCTCTGDQSYAQGNTTTASAPCAHAEGQYTKAIGAHAHAEGVGSEASGANSHAEGQGTKASGDCSHAEGQTTQSTAFGSHAEGAGTNASGMASHAEGNSAKAGGNYSHAEGSGTIASGNNQHAQGAYNVEDLENQYAHIVGGGTYQERKNIHTIDWQGNAWFAGDIINGNGVSLDELVESIGSAVPEWAQQPEKPTYTKAEIGLKNVDNTSDTNKPVSTAQQEAIDAAYQQATGYTDQSIADLINGAPSTLDTLGEIAQAMQENNDVVDALEAAVGTKSSQAELDGHISNNTIHITASERQAWNDKQTPTGDTKDNTATFDSGDATAPASWADVPALASGEKHSGIFNKVSTMFRNIRYLYKMLGTADISAIGDGTVTGAISMLNTNVTRVQSNQQEIIVDANQINITLPHRIKILICIHIDGYAPAIIDRYNYSTSNNETVITVHFAEIPNDKVRIRTVYVAA